ncbi:uncharacterized protein LOC144549346 [Carex rostrata]
MASELRPVMPVDLFMAAIEGNNNLLIPRLGLQHEEPTTDQIQMTIEATHSSPEQINTELQSEQINTELQSATGFGDTVLHVLVTHGHNVLALKVFQRDRSLLNAHNKMSETPLHCAAKVGNGEFMCKLNELDPVIVKDAMKEIDENGDTPFHVATKHGHVHVVRKLMLEVDHTLACIPFSDGMFPVHVSASMGNIELVIDFIIQYPNCAKLLDPRGRNFFHIAAEKNRTICFMVLFEVTDMGQMIKQMNNATDNEGNTPLHIAAMKGHKSIMETIWENKMGIEAEEIRNNEGLTPFQLSWRQQLETNEDTDNIDINWHVAHNGSKFTREWFDDVMNPALKKDKWEKIQVLGLGSVLITTVAFAATFTVPGGYDQNNGTPVLGKKYMFRAFILANTFAFIQGFASLSVLLWESKSVRACLDFATTFLLLAASSMVVAFGLGMYVTLAPICYPIAVLILVITLITGSPLGILLTTNCGPDILKSISPRLNTCSGICGLLLFTFPFLLIFCLALL